MNLSMETATYNFTFPQHKHTHTHTHTPHPTPPQHISICKPALPFLHGCILPKTHISILITTIPKYPSTPTYLNRCSTYWFLSQYSMLWSPWTMSGSSYNYSLVLQVHYSSCLDCMLQDVRGAPLLTLHQHRMEVSTGPCQRMNDKHIAF